MDETVEGLMIRSEGPGARRDSPASFVRGASFAQKYVITLIDSGRLTDTITTSNHPRKGGGHRSSRMDSLYRGGQR